MVNLRIDLKSGVSTGFLIFNFLLSLAQTREDSLAIHEIETHRLKQKEEFRDKKLSPLAAPARRKFKGLNYYPIDLHYRVPARFVRTENTALFKMKTTTDRLPEYLKYGEVYFELEGKSFALEVYQSPEISSRPGYEDYLFIPFTDLTNGVDTYEVGRYLEFRIPSSDTVVIDFNQCYNPYCSYGGAYSCPIPPQANHLPISIPTGEKKYTTSH